MGATVAEPDVADALKLLPVQDVALVEDQVRVEDCPAVIDLGLADRDALGATGVG